MSAVGLHRRKLGWNRGSFEGLSSRTGSKRLFLFDE